MSNILITGIQGFIGQALAKSLAKNNFIVGLGFDQIYDSDAHQVVYGDIRNYGLISRIIADYEIEEIYHMAAQSIVRVCANDPVNAYDINVMGTVNLLEACRTVGRNRVRSILINTSDKAYGHVAPPYDENTPLKPLFTYESTKACQDIVAQNYAHNYGMPIKVARCSNIYGPGDRNYSRLIPNSVCRCLRNEAPVLHNGVHNYVREFVYIQDIVDAFMLITKQGGNGEVYCVGGTEHYRVIEVIEKIIQQTNPDLVPEIHDKDAVFKEIQEQWIDSGKLQKLGWQPRFSLDKGLALTIGYYRENINEK